MFDDESIRFKVVANHQEQYSIWPDFKEIPAGWIAVGPEGAKESCLEYIERVWTDMRPKSLRDKMRSADDAPRPGAAAQKAAQEVLAASKQQVQEYAAGKPELYGWFVAQVMNKDADLDPQAVRAALDHALPPHNIPSHYA